MPIITVNYQKTYNLGNYSSERIGIEISINEGQNPKEALQEAKKLADEFHLDNNKGLYVENMITGVASTGIASPIIQQTATKKQENTKPLTLIEQINTCTEVKVLESYKLIVRNNPDANEAYRKKLVELSNQ